MKNSYRAHSQSASTKVSKNFKTADLAIMMALLLIVGSVSGGIVSEAFEDVRPHYAALEVEHLAINLSQSEVGLNKVLDPAQSQSRVPASVQAGLVNEISKDPWGTPYRYKVLKAQSGQIKVIVVSAGPNKIFESDLTQNETFSKELSGDDIGFVYDSSQKKLE